MNKSNTFVLIHSPLVGPLTWRLVAEELRRQGLDTLIPTLSDSADSKEPFWKQHAGSFANALAELPKDRPITLVAHSGQDLCCRHSGNRSRIRSRLMCSWMQAFRVMEPAGSIR